MTHRTTEGADTPSAADSQPLEPSATDAAASARPADHLAEELFTRRLGLPSRRTLRLARVLPPLAGVVLGVTLRSAAEAVGVGPEIALALGATVLVSACVLGVAAVLRHRREP